MNSIVKFIQKVNVEGNDRRPLRTNSDRRRFLSFFTALILVCLTPQRMDAQVLDIISIINTAIKKVIVAADLEVQRLQNQTIGLQNTQKQLENTMQQSELSGIAGWVQQQRDLFAGYYQELLLAKNALVTYEAVKDMIEKQVQIVSGYRQASAILRQDRHFSVNEVTHLSAVLSGIVKQSEQNLKRLEMVVQSLVTQMDDAARLRIIDEAGSGINKNYSDLAQFSQQSYLLSVQRSTDAHDIMVTRALYGIE